MSFSVLALFAFLFLVKYSNFPKTWRSLKYSLARCYHNIMCVRAARTVYILHGGFWNILYFHTLIFVYFHFALQ